MASITLVGSRLARSEDVHHGFKSTSSHATAKSSKSLFSVSSGQSLPSQFDDTIFVLRRIVLTSRLFSSGISFAKRYVSLFWPEVEYGETYLQMENNIPSHQPI
jgi:hypothetical protein